VQGKRNKMVTSVMPLYHHLCSEDSINSINYFPHSQRPYKSNGLICGYLLRHIAYLFTRRNHTRDEHWTGLALDWIRTMTTFVDFGLDPDCKMLHKFGIRTGFGLI